MPNDNDSLSNNTNTPPLPQGKTGMWIEGVEPDPTKGAVNNRKVQPPLYTDRKQALKRLQKT